MSNGDFANPWDEGGALASDWSSNNAQVLTTPSATGSSSRPSWTAYRKLPALVWQKNAWSCWAAAIESWLGVVNAGRPQYTQSELIDKYSSYPVNDPKYGAIESDDLQIVLEELRISFYAMEGRAVTTALIAETLKSKGHIIIMYPVTGYAGHTIIVYGIGYPSGDILEISVMDPDKGYINLPFSDFKNKAGILIVAWPSTN